MRCARHSAFDYCLNSVASKQSHLKLKFAAQWQLAEGRLPDAIRQENEIRGRICQARQR